MGVDDGRERQELFFRAHSKCKDLWTLESEAKICFWVITVNLTRHWRTQENMEACHMTTCHWERLGNHVTKSERRQFKGRRKNKEWQTEKLRTQHTMNWIVRVHSRQEIKKTPIRRKPVGYEVEREADLTQICHCRMCTKLVETVHTESDAY